MSMGSAIVLASIGMAGGGRNMYSDVSIQFLYINGITYMTGENRLAGLMMCFVMFFIYIFA